MTAIALAPRPRTIIHPGRFNPVRIHSRHAARGRHFRLSLQPGLTLFEALVGPLHELGVRSASTTILGGWFDDVWYCVAPPEPTGRTVVGYSEPRRAGRAYLVFGNATLGKSINGGALVHCHGTLLTGTGTVRGGHILPESAVIGPQEIAVLATAFDGFELQQAFDPETHMPLFQPKEVTGNE